MWLCRCLNWILILSENMVTLLHGKVTRFDLNIHVIENSRTWKSSDFILRALFVFYKMPFNHLKKKILHTLAVCWSLLLLVWMNYIGRKCSLFSDIWLHLSWKMAPTLKYGDGFPLRPQSKLTSWGGIVSLKGVSASHTSTWYIFFLCFVATKEMLGN